LDVLGNKVKFDTENQPQLQGRYMCVIKSKAVRRVTCFWVPKTPNPGLLHWGEWLGLDWD